MPKTRVIPQEQSSNIVLPIEIQKVVDERGFYLYEWVRPHEYLLSLLLSSSQDTIKFMQFIVVVIVNFAFILLILSTFYTYHFPVFLLFIPIVGLIICGLVMLYFLRFLIKRPYQNAGSYIQISKIILTNKVAFIQEKIIGHKELILETKNSGDLFYKPIFTKGLFGSKGFLNNIGGIGGLFGIGSIKKALASAKNPGDFLLAVLVGPILIFCFSFILLIIRFIVGIIFIVFLKLITFFSHYTETRINSLFSVIEKSSSILQFQKQKLLDSIESETGFYDFQKSFSILSRSADLSILNSHKLEKLLERSKFHDIFDFEIYHSWIRKQVREPLEQILELVERNSQILIETKERLSFEIAKTTNQNLCAPLELQMVRIDEQIEGFERNKPILVEYLAKLSK